MNDTIFLWIPTPFYELRAMLLRLFGARIGKHTRISNRVKIRYPMFFKCGNNVTIDRWCNIHNTIDFIIDDNASLATGVRIILGGHNVRSREFEFVGKPLHIHNACFIGGGSLLVGCEIGTFSVIGAGSFVNKDIPENTIAYGHPAKVVSERIPNEEYIKYRYSE